MVLSWCENTPSNTLISHDQYLNVIKLKGCCSRLQSNRQHIGSGGGMSQGGVQCGCWQCSGPLGRILISAHALYMSGFLTHALASSCLDLSPYVLIFAFHVLTATFHVLTTTFHILTTLFHILTFTFHIPTSTFLYPARMSTSSGLWVCSECGKVCKSHGGLTQHSAVHKHHPYVRELDKNSTCFYHPNLDGRFEFSFSFASPNLPKENHANWMESSSPMTPQLSQWWLVSVWIVCWIQTCQDPIQQSLSLKQHHWPTSQPLEHYADSIQSLHTNPWSQWPPLDNWHNQTQPCSLAIIYCPV